MNHVNGERLDEYLDSIDREIARSTCHVWWMAWRRGLVTATELIRFMAYYEYANTWRVS